MQSFKNTEGTYKKAKHDDEFDQKLMAKMEEEKYKYDFKYIKKEFKSTIEMDRDIYLKYDDLVSAVRNP